MPQLRVRSPNYAGGYTIRFAFSMASAYASGRIIGSHCRLGIGKPREDIHKLRHLRRSVQVNNEEICQRDGFP